MSETIIESKNWILLKEFLHWDYFSFSITLKETGESIIMSKEQLQELLSYNNVPLGV